MLLLKKILRRFKRILGITGATRISETSKVREQLLQYCVGDGLDLGYGGDPISESAICMDLPKKYAAYQSHPQHLHGDARDLHWFRDDVLDYVYSSHVLEDFEDTESVLKEWLRVVRPGGSVVLFLPDEQTYRKHCMSLGKPPNEHHIHEFFGPKYLWEIVEKLENAEVIHEAFPIGIYSFEMVIKKT
ncbi:class I SAM-dependent methyltransferase [Coraliomargarita sp. SDUM461004]|uniref:Class I SAM-dependent methyltransferase n=1 Tax=Thalassobacterium sedimentorum TaxID=3041258 RepID=A0ABU1AEU6_9BACT|nr:class I SAM-dependent methyltransferase [Coraliomargarita sp. SDUM461004]MDQ8193291.1 class I SAM-dependent methyltransferase [Coraliomargarita sp. SDUM461004]